MSEERVKGEGGQHSSSLPPPSKWEWKSKSCCISVLLCCDVAQAEPDTEQQAALWTSSQTQDQPSLVRAGDHLPAASLAATACPPRRHVPRRQPGVWRGCHCGLPGRDVRLCCPHPCPDSSLFPLHPWLLLCSSGRTRTTLRWEPSVPGQRAQQPSSVCALQPPSQPLHAPAHPPLSGNHLNTHLQVRE